MFHQPAAINARHFLDEELIRRCIRGMFHNYACNVASSRRYRPTQLFPYTVQMDADG